MVMNGYTYDNGELMDQVVVNSRHLMTQHESPADGAVRVGMLVEETADGVAPHATDGARPETLYIAITARGNVIGDTYEAGERVPYMELAGGKVQGLLATGESVALADPLVSAGDGTLRAAAGDGTDAGAAVGHVPNDPPVNGEYAVDNAAGDDAAGVFCEVSN